jgi:hypothetical protein
MESCVMAEADVPEWTHYSGLERALHRIAFATPGLPKIFGELDKDIFAPKDMPELSGPPVFVTGLPRAGTTLLLELLAGSGAFASFTYRHMPFVLAPCMWSKLTGRYRQEGEKVQRSHGDGMEIGFDSPEAFEEVAWIAFHGKDYVKDDHLIPMDRLKLDVEFAPFMHGLARRLAVTAGQGPRRYLSKNNANIGRLNTLKKLDPAATALVCLRDPVSHAASLARQHDRFLGIHAEDKFAAKYMRWIGHFDFGANFKPIRFAETLDPEAPDFWLRYWIEAYSYALPRIDAQRQAFCYERLLDAPEAVLGRLAGALDLPDPDRFIAGAAQVRRGAPPPMDPPAGQEALARTARDLYAAIADKAL